MTKVRKDLLSGTGRFRPSPTGSYGRLGGILRAWGQPTADRRIAQALTRTRRRLHSHSWRLLRASQLAREAARVARWYRGCGGRNRMARPAPPPVAALSEVETMFRAGFRSIRAWRWARKHGGFPEPARVTPQGPIWTERQIAQWLGEMAYLDRLDVASANDVVSEASEAEAAILRELEVA
jgi:hypothetical protein